AWPSCGRGLSGATPRNVLAEDQAPANAPEDAPLPPDGEAPPPEQDAAPVEMVAAEEPAPPAEEPAPPVEEPAPAVEPAAEDSPVDEAAPPVEPAADENAPAPGDAPEFQQAETVAKWTFVPSAPAPADPAPALPLDPAAAGAAAHDLEVPQNLDSGYLKDLFAAIAAQGVNGNDALAALAQQPR
ncbi:MAG: transglycosylase family protein, partial [Mycobacterium sp.]